MKEIKTMTASEGKIFAHKDENGEEILLGNILYLGVNDDGSRYYEVDDPTYKPEPQVIENPDYNIE